MNHHNRRLTLHGCLALALASLASSAPAQLSDGYYTGYEVSSQSGPTFEGHSQPSLWGVPSANRTAFSGHLGGQTTSSSQAELGSLTASTTSQGSGEAGTRGSAQAMFGDTLTISGRRNTVVKIALTMTLEDALDAQGSLLEGSVSAWLSLGGAPLIERGRTVQGGGLPVEFGGSNTFVLEAPVDSTLFLTGGLLTDATVFGTSRVTASGHARYYVQVLTPDVSVTSASGMTYAQPVPEPASLLALGAGALALLRRKKRSA